MHRRGGIAQNSGVTPPPPPVRVSALNGRLKHRQRVSTVWIAAGCFIVCVLLYLCLTKYVKVQSNTHQRPRRFPTKHSVVTERDVMVLDMATSQAAKRATLQTLDHLIKTAAELGAVYVQLLEQVAAAQELDDSGRALRELDVSQHHLSTVGSALRGAADVSYTKLKAMLLQEANAEIHEAPTSLMRTTFSWMLGDLYIYSAVLPEYYLLQDDTPNHARALLRAINLLSWSPRVHTVPLAEARERNTPVRTYDLFNWSGGAACRRGLLGDVWHSRNFCESSFSSWSAVARRVAATYEELIVLYPSYAPFRLHYSISFAFLAMDTAADVVPGGSHGLVDHTAKALKVIRNDRAKLESTYAHVDAVHGFVLALLEAFLTPVGLRTVDKDTQLVAALRGWKSCAEAKAALLGATTWPGDVFPGEYRPPLLRDTHLSHLLAKAQMHLGEDHVSLRTLRSC
ncbi:hypothetical protein JKF63_00800 [Porcisia hertigi]|uniref:Uncharacterized protein n=1 Tax=Porcisia hertigi TaxID=2761500 RepID=A0A836IA85_9TRYP|nr:hypothetical protein JKF63_00800 [Porcisia hertigi]